MIRILFLILTLCSSLAQAEMVDTFQFQSDEARVRAVALAKSLRCPQCQNQNLVESNATQAYKLRLEVYEMVNQGKSNEEIVQLLTQRYGNFVNYQPPFNPQTWALWGLPFLLLVSLLGAILWRGRRK